MLKVIKKYGFFGNVRYELEDTERPYVRQKVGDDNDRPQMNSVFVVPNKDGSVYLKQGNGGILLTQEMINDLSKVIPKLIKKQKTKKT